MGLNFHFEYLKSSNRCVLSINIDPQTIKSRFSIKKITKDSQNILECIVDDEILNIPIGKINILQDNPSVSKFDDCLRIIFDTDPSQGYSFDEFMENTPSQLNIKSIYCKICGLSILKEDLNKEKLDVYSLPGENWSEMKDIWVCACTSDLLNSSRTIASGIIRAQKDKVFVGADHILLHGSNIQQLSLIELKSTKLVSKKRTWVDIQCIRCLCNIGKHEIIEPNQTSFENVLLYKHQITTSKSISNNSFGEHNFETFFSVQILKSIFTNNLYRFLIRDIESRNYIVYITILNWNILHLTNISPLSDQTLKPCIKIIFKDLRQSKEDISEFIQSYEVIDLNIQSCLQLLGVLAKRNKSLPKDQKNIKDMKHSYLYYLPFEDSLV